MIYIPFIYFSLLSILIYRRNREVDLAVITSLVYATSGFFAIFIDMLDLRYVDVENYKISLEATIAYCGLLTMCILPLVFNSHLDFKNIKPIHNERLLRFLAWFAFIWFLISFTHNWQSMLNVLTGDMAQARADVRSGWGQSVTWFASYPAPIRFVLGIIVYFFGCPWTLLFLAFFARYIQKMPQKYFLLFFTASLSGPMNGIIGADRSATAYWIMALLAMYIFFQNNIEKPQRKKIISFGIVLIGTLSLYLAAMTIARFGESDYGNVSGTQGGLITYFGQSFVNFCYYYDNYEPPFIHLGIIFPFISDRILGIPSGGVVIQEQMSAYTGLWTGVFYTFIGHIIIGAGKIVALIYCFIYTFASSICLRTISQRKETSISSLYLFFAFASVIYLGLFGHYYAGSSLTFGLITMYIMIRIIERTR